MQLFANRRAENKPGAKVKAEEKFPFCPAKSERGLLLVARRFVDHFHATSRKELGPHLMVAEQCCQWWASGPLGPRRLMKRLRKQLWPSGAPQGSAHWARVAQANSFPIPIRSLIYERPSVSPGLLGAKVGQLSQKVCGRASVQVTGR